jgi:5-methylcytosine-specific restriction endonuclease McrA
MSLRLSPELYAELVQSVFERDSWKCRFCGFRRVHAHHIIYRSEGGPDASCNLCSLCPACHEAIHQGKMSIWAEDQFLGADGPLEFVTAPGWKP